MPCAGLPFFLNALLEMTAAAPVPGAKIGKSSLLGECNSSCLALSLLCVTEDLNIFNSILSRRPAAHATTTRLGIASSVQKQPGRLLQQLNGDVYQASRVEIDCCGNKPPVPSCSYTTQQSELPANTCAKNGLHSAGRLF